MKNIRKLLFLLMLLTGGSPSTPAKECVVINDEIIFGDIQSEKKHIFIAVNSDLYTGGLNETARRMLPAGSDTFQGGTLSFRMKVDPEKQNYFTVRCFGSETDHTVVMLFIEGLQTGYRHLGDHDYLWMGNQDTPFTGRYYYITLPLPIQHTKGKKEVSLELRSYGSFWGYGDSFEKYQRPMTTPTIGFYKAYTHTNPFFEPHRKEKQGLSPAYKVKETPGPEVLGHLKERVNNELEKIISKEILTSQQEMWFLADAWNVPWTIVYKRPGVKELLIHSIDSFCERAKLNPDLIIYDPSIYNSEWLTVAPIARVVRMLWEEIEPELTDSRRHEWVKIFKASQKYSVTHRRQYTNQSMIIDLFMYDVNKTLLLLSPTDALPEYQVLKYLHESVGLCPWSGINNDYFYGTNYWQLTRKALTKELGYVGNYGEVLDWVIDIYRSTCIPGFPESGDPQIKEQLLRIMEARSYFRHPGVDKDGNTVMRMECVIGWRDGGHYPGDIVYGDRGMGWDSTPLMTAAVTLDPRAVGMAQQMIRDNQFFAMVEKKMESKGIRVTKALLHIPCEYEKVMAQPISTYKMPMAQGSPDFVFSDEENGVIALKNGEEIFYTSLYWRARYGINNLAKIHYITPVVDRIATVVTETIYEDSGMKYTRPDRVNLAFSHWGEWYEGIHSAHTGEILPIARIPEEINFKPGDESIYAGKAQFYKMHYGKYIIGMNCTTDKTFELDIPRVNGRKILNLTDPKETVSKNQILISPMSTVVLYIQ